MNRRALLISLGTVGVAGCSSLGPTTNGGQGNDNGGQTGGTQFGAVSLSAPDSATFGDPISVEVSVTNEGDKAGTFQNELVAGGTGYSVSRSVAVENVPSGETKRAQFEIRPAVAGDVEVGIPAHDASTTVSVSTRSEQPGNTVTVGDALALTLSGVSFHPSLVAQSEDEKRVVAPDGEFFAVLQVTMKNRTAEPYTVPSGTFAVDGTATHASLGPFDGDLTTIQLAGSPLPGAEIQPEKTASGWLVASVSPQNSVDVAWDHDGSDPVEVAWTVGDLNLPRYEVVETDFPEKIQISDEAKFSVTVDNERGEKTSIPYALERRRPTERSWTQVDIGTVSLSSYQEKEIAPEVEDAYLGEFLYRMVPFTEPKRVEFTPAKLRFGDTYSDDRGLELTTVKTEFGDRYRWKSDYGGAYETPDSAQFMFVQVRAENTSDDRLPHPQREEFEVAFQGQTFGPSRPDTEHDVEFWGPVRGPEYRPEDAEIDPKEIVTGWLVFEVPPTANLESATFKFVSSLDAGDIEIRWSNSF